MKKSTLVIGALVAALAAPCAMAVKQAPDQDTFRFECPNASGGVASERLTNYGTSISGMGEESYNGSKVALPIFKGIPDSGVPLDLSTGGYSHAGTLYNPKTGRITCLFTSSTKPAFNVSYVAENAMNGFVTKSDNSAITIEVGQG